MIDVTSAFQGISSLSALYSQISDLGWSVKKVKYDKKRECYVAEASNAAGDTVEKTGDRDSTAVANLLVAVTRKTHMRTAAQRKVAMWKYNFIDQLKEIAEAYVKAPTYDPKAASAFKELGDDCTHRALALRNHLDVQIIANPHPYTDAQKMADDVHKKRRLIVSSAATEHPLWTPEQVISFRIAFDVLGYVAAGAEWDWRGDNLAFGAFAPLLSTSAQQALFTEVIAQSAYVNRFKAYGPQKVALFKEFIETAQDAEGATKAKGTHPSQSFPPVAPPTYKPPKDAVIPPVDGPIGLPATLGSVNPEYADPNSNWQSGVEPLELNAYIHHGDPLEYPAAMTNAELTDSHWHEFVNGEGQPDYDRMKQAIVNAFRGALLSPRKNFMWNNIHYQDVDHIPAGTDNPSVYRHAMEEARKRWNEKRFGEDHTHLIYEELLPPVENIVYKLDPSQGYERSKQRALRMVEDWIVEEQNHLMRQDEDKPAEMQIASDEVEKKSFEAVAKRMKTYIKDSKKDMDVKESAEAVEQPESDSEQGLEPSVIIPPVNPLGTKYAGYIGNYIKAMAVVSKNADKLLDAALTDIHQHDGSGHHFRNITMQLRLPYVGQKVASFAWLLLSPMTSQIAALDTHMLKALGHDPKTDYNNRDYTRFERELAAGRDAAGYGHMPLGVFQWALWDHQRTGPGTHQDHSGLKPIEPTPYEQIEFPESVSSAATPDWWENTKNDRKQIGEDWERHVAPNYTKDSIPYLRINAPTLSFSPRQAFRVGPTPWFRHPNGSKMYGVPGQTIMQHARSVLGWSTPEIWETLSEAGKE